MSLTESHNEKPILQLADGIEMLGAFDGDALIEKPHMIRRTDGQILQVSPLVYAIADAMSSEQAQSSVELAKATTQNFGREVSADNVEYLVEHKISPLGILKQDALPRRVAPLLALRLRQKVVPERWHRAVSTALKPLFHGSVVAVFLVALLVGDIWVATMHGSAFKEGVNALISHPTSFLLISALGVFMGMFHELGHATAARYGGAKPGVMGVGVYLVWPVFYTDVTDSYRLGRGGRLRTDLGGIYFNIVGIVLCLTAYAITGFTPLLIFAFLTHIDVAYQFLPFVRLDGYWMLSDAVGVPNLFAYMKPILAKLAGHSSEEGEARLAEIKPRSRRLITGWVVATFSFIVVSLGVLLYIAPYFLTRTLSQLNVDSRAAISAFGDGDGVVGISNLISTVLLAIPLLGIMFMSILILRKVLTAIVRVWPHRPVMSTAFACLLLFVMSGEVVRFIPGAPQQPRDNSSLVAAGMLPVAPNLANPYATIPVPVPAPVPETNPDGSPPIPTSMLANAPASRVSSAVPVSTTPTSTTPSTSATSKVTTTPTTAKATTTSTTTPTRQQSTTTTAPRSTSTTSPSSTSLPRPTTTTPSTQSSGNSSSGASSNDGNLLTSVGNVVGGVVRSL